MSDFPQTRKPWRRLWCEMPTDPKWRTVAKKSNRPLVEVVALFTLMLTIADDDGDLGSLDLDDAASALDMDPDHVEAIISAMQGKVLNDRQISGWAKRQPKREDNSTERVRAFRAKSNETKRNETQCNASETQGNAPEKRREEKIREDINITLPSNQEPAREAEQQPPEAEALEGRQELKSVLNGATDGMIADVRAWMGPTATDAHASKWLTSTIAAYGHERTVRAHSIIVAKLGGGEIVSMPLALWSRTAQGLRSEPSGKDPPKKITSTQAAIARRLAAQAADAMSVSKKVS